MPLGGIADGRGLAAVLMLGAEGAWLGSRFVASHEAIDPDWKKQRAVQASADDTILTKVYDLIADAPFPKDIGDRYSGTALRPNGTDTIRKY